MAKNTGPERPDVAAIAWYRRADYDRLRLLNPDGGGMEETFDDWHKLAKRALAEVRAQGVPVEKIVVDPDELAAWLRARDLKSNNETRALYVWEIAASRHTTKH